MLTGAQVSPSGLTIAFDMPAVPSNRATLIGRPGRFKQISVVAGQDSLVNLKVTTSATAVPGQFTAKLIASSQALGTAEQTIYVNVLGPIPADNPCSLPTTAEVLPVRALLAGLFTAKAGSPTKTEYQVGAATTTASNGWAIEITHEDPVPRVPLKPNEALIVFANTTKGGKDLWTIDSRHQDCQIRYDVPSFSAGRLCRSGFRKLLVWRSLGAGRGVQRAAILVARGRPGGEDHLDVQRRGLVAADPHPPQPSSIAPNSAAIALRAARTCPGP